jgi:nucleoside-diphosphate-sugar epimerase
MDILVTGGCGYIGSRLIPQLQARSGVDSVTVFDSLVSGSPRNLIGARVSDGFSFRDGDAREYGDVESAMRDVDTVIHLAAITGASTTHDRREETFAVNYDGTENVLKAAKKLGVSNVVFASSCNVYGRAPTTDIDETTDPDPINPYAESKLESETLLESYVDEEMDGTALRMSTVYGYAPGIRFNLVVNHFVFRALTGRPLTVYGDGTNWRPFIHIEDAARAFAEAALHPDDWQHLRYNVGSNAGNYQIKDIAAAVRDELDSELEITYLEDEHPGPSYHVNFDRLAEPGFSTEVSLRDGIRDLAERFTGPNAEGRID